MPSTYVYGLTVDGVCRYFGKGVRDRMGDHMRQVRAIARQRAAGFTPHVTFLYANLVDAWLAGAEVEVFKLHEGLTDAEAQAIERQLILDAPEGQLWNTKTGGCGCTSEAARQAWGTPERRRAQGDRSRAYWGKVKRGEADPPVMPADSKERQRAAMRARKGKLKKGVQRDVLAYIRKNPGCTSANLKAAFPGRVLKSWRLVRDGLVRREGEQWAGVFYPATVN